jgi:hypothetical protein
MGYKRADSKKGKNLRKGYMTFSKIKYLYQRTRSGSRGHIISNQMMRDGRYRRPSISLKGENNITTYAGYRSTWQDNNLSSNLLSLLHTRKDSKYLVSTDEFTGNLTFKI